MRISWVFVVVAGQDLRRTLIIDAAAAALPAHRTFCAVAANERFGAVKKF